MALTKTTNLVEKVLKLVQREAFQEAVEVWVRRQSKNGICSDQCIYGEGLELCRCARCIEGRLRVISLNVYHTEDVPCPYQTAARKLKEWAEANAPNPSH